MKKPVGRPPKIIPEPNDAERVERYVAAGMQVQDIARVFGVSVDTLRRTFRESLRAGAAKQRAEAIDMLWRSARGGNVSAQRTIVGMIDNAEQRVEDQRVALIEEAEQEARGPKLGKKEQRVLDAESAGLGSFWGDDLLPSGRGN